jgi:serine/threonine-protein kinase RsbW
VATVTLELESRPESLILARGMLVGIADSLGFDADLLHALKTVVSEACNNVVLHAYDGQPGPYAVGLEVTAEGVEAVVRDWGCGIRRIAPSDDRIRVGLAVISTIADRAQFRRASGGGTEVRMAFTGRPGVAAPEPRGAVGEKVEVVLAGDAIATLSPVRLLGGVLGRVAGGLAARARFSLDRFGDVSLLTDALAAQAEDSALGSDLGFAVAAYERRLELTVGPFRPGSGVELGAQDELGRLGPALSSLAVELAVEPVAGAEVWRLVMLDRDSALGAVVPL